jgi:hypothetical protein
MALYCTDVVSSVVVSVPPLVFLCKSSHSSLLFVLLSRLVYLSLSLMVSSWPHLSLGLSCPYVGGPSGHNYAVVSMDLASSMPVSVVVFSPM